MAEYRVSVYGRKQSEWDQLASWFVNNKLYSENAIWLIQVRGNIRPLSVHSFVVYSVVFLVRNIVNMYSMRVDFSLRDITHVSAPTISIELYCSFINVAC